MNDKPYILCDVDGVCLDWCSKLPEYLLKHGIDNKKSMAAYAHGEYISPEELTGLSIRKAHQLLSEYNASEWIKYLVPYKDALQVVNLLKKEFNFIAVTSIGVDPECSRKRMMNLEFWFPGAFIDIKTVDIGESKLETLKQFKSTFFIDDSPQYVKEGKEAGHISIRLVRDKRLDLINTIRCNDFFEVGSKIEELKWMIKS